MSNKSGFLSSIVRRVETDLAKLLQAGLRPEAMTGAEMLDPEVRRRVRALSADTRTVRGLADHPPFTRGGRC